MSKTDSAWSLGSCRRFSLWSLALESAGTSMTFTPWSFAASWMRVFSKVFSFRASGREDVTRFMAEVVKQPGLDLCGVTHNFSDGRGRLEVSVEIHLTHPIAVDDFKQWIKRLEEGRGRKDRIADLGLIHRTVMPVALEDHPLKHTAMALL